MEVNRRGFGKDRPKMPMEEDYVCNSKTADGRGFCAQFQNCWWKRILCAIPKLLMEEDSVRNSKSADGRGFCAQVLTTNKINLALFYVWGGRASINLFPIIGISLHLKLFNEYSSNSFLSAHLFKWTENDCSESQGVSQPVHLQTPWL